VPTYQYACTACGNKLEAVQSFSDAPLIECPECSGRLRKLFSSVGIVFKGSGFYRNDSRADSSDKTKAKSDAPAKTDAAKESTSSTSGKDGGSGSTKSDSTKSDSSSGSSSSSGSGSSRSSGSTSSKSTPAGAAA
jgi:putative FmdB family regulatory protein